MASTRNGFMLLETALNRRTRAILKLSLNLGLSLNDWVIVIYFSQIDITLTRLVTL